MFTLEDRAKAYNSLKKSPLEIKVYMATPIVLPGYGIHLDALLTESVARELFGNDLDRWQNQDKHEEIPLPLEKTTGTHPIWKASIAFTSTFTREHQDFWIKRTNDEFSGYVSGKIVWPAGVISSEVSKSLAKEVRLEPATGPANSSASGGFKSYYESRNLLATDCLIFHAYGNKDEVERLLTNIKGIGKKVAIGFGKINKFEVTETDSDYSLFTPNDQPARNLPVEDYPNLRAQIIASPLLPPYWSKRSLVLCYTTSSPIPKWQWSEEKKAISVEESWFDEEYQEEEWFDG